MIRTIVQRLSTLALAVFFAASLLPSTLSAQSIEDGDPVQGEALFQTCRTCHAIDRQVVGPALSEVYNRHDIEWIVGFVQNSTAMIESGDPAAVQLWNDYQPNVMTAFPKYGRQEVANILAYIKQQDETAPVAEASGGAGQVDPNEERYNSVIANGFATLTVSLTILLVVMAGIIAVVVIGLSRAGAMKSLMSSNTNEPQA